MQKRIADYPILYSGSVKKVRTFDDTTLLFEFTDQVSVFDWGALPNLIPSKGRALAEMGASFFENLSNPKTWQNWAAKVGCATFLFKDTDFFEEIEKLKKTGLKSHYIRSVLEEDTRALLVERVNVVRPDLNVTNGQTKFQYTSKRKSGELIPLEVVFRHELVAGSSVLKRDLSLSPGDRFEIPRIEFYTKLEPQDRYLTEDEAIVVSGLDANRFAELQRKTIILSVYLKTFFEQFGVQLIDGKFEWALGKSDDLILVDSIGPDELRILRDGRDLSKETLREFYRGTDWYREVTRQKSTGDLNWKSHVTLNPPVMPANVIAEVSKNYQWLASQIIDHTSVDRPSEKVLLVGSGAREHALAKKILQSNRVKELYWSTHNEVALNHLQNLFKNKKITKWDEYLPTNYSLLSKRAFDEEITIAVIGPDQPLADGIADQLELANVSVFGPRKMAARLEWSKSFSKQVMKGAGVSTARSFEISSVKALVAKLHDLDWSQPWVIKADGLALGKGVIVCKNVDEALAAADTLAQYGSDFVVEEFLIGREISMFALCDGETCSYFGSAQDYKTLFDGQKGPNTGGMGAISPAPKVSREFEKKIFIEVFLPVVREMKKKGTPYVGVLYAGLMVQNDQYWVLEFNCRFGDPEAQALLPRVNDDLVFWMKACAQRRLSTLPRFLSLSDKSKYYVVAAAEGYPANPKKGVCVPGIDLEKDQSLYFAGIKKQGEDWVTSGGRVLGALSDSRIGAYDLIEKIRFQGMQIRRDIGGDLPKILVLASGRGSNFLALQQAIQKGKLDADLIALGCNRKEAPVFSLAKEFGVETFHIQNEKILQDEIKKRKPDYVILAGYDRILSAECVELMRAKTGKSRIINIHPSLLPAFKGLHSYEKAFQAGVKETGVTVHRVEPDLDSGPILSQQSFSIESCKSSSDVEKIGLMIEHKIYASTLQKLFREVI